MVIRKNVLLGLQRLDKIILLKIKGRIDMSKDLDHIALVVNNIKDSVEFYCKSMSLKCLYCDET